MVSGLVGDVSLGWLGFLGYSLGSCGGWVGVWVSWYKVGGVVLAVLVLWVGFFCGLRFVVLRGFGWAWLHGFILLGVGGGFVSWFGFNRATFGRVRFGFGTGLWLLRAWLGWLGGGGGGRLVLCGLFSWLGLVLVTGCWVWLVICGGLGLFGAWWWRLGGGGGGWVSSFWMN